LHTSVMVWAALPQEKSVKCAIAYRSQGTPRASVLTGTQDEHDGGIDGEDVRL
jgi:hypothetical protein